MLAYLELFRIHHALGDRVSYEALESEFRQTFGIDFKSFGQFKDEQLELEGFPSVVNRIGVRWPSEQSQSVIEDSCSRGLPTSANCCRWTRTANWSGCTNWVGNWSNARPAGRPAAAGRLGLPNNHFILPWAIGHEDGPPELSLDRLSAIDVASDLHGFAVDIDLGALSGDAVPRPGANNEAGATWTPSTP